ncbi:hypothetical protein BT69DRAFT_1342754, partial [Atractiella rhizophila]
KRPKLTNSASSGGFGLLRSISSFFWGGKKEDSEAEVADELLGGGGGMDGDGERERSVGVSESSGIGEVSDPEVEDAGFANSTLFSRPTSNSNSKKRGSYAISDNEEVEEEEEDGEGERTMTMSRTFTAEDLYPDLSPAPQLITPPRSKATKPFDPAVIPTTPAISGSLVFPHVATPTHSPHASRRTASFVPPSRAMTTATSTATSAAFKERRGEGGDGENVLGELERYIQGKGEEGIAEVERVLKRSTGAKKRGRESNLEGGGVQTTTLATVNPNVAFAKLSDIGIVSSSILALVLDSIFSPLE